MAVVKRKDMAWKEYLDELISNKIRITDIEKREFSGFLMRRDMLEDKEEDYLKNDNIYILCQSIANYMIAESKESTEELLHQIKKTIIDHYELEINKLLNQTKN